MYMLTILNRLLPAFLLVSAFLPLNSADAQCCSTGSPVGASTQVGIVNKGTVRAITFFRHSFSDIYYRGSVPSNDEIDMSDDAQYDFWGVTIEYGLTHRLTLQADAGYFINKLVNFSNPVLTDHNGRGLSNGTLMLKYGLFVNQAKHIEVSAGLGVKFPFSRQPATASNGTLLQLDARPSTNAYGVTGSLLLSKEFDPLTMRIFMLNRFEYNGFNINDYQSGKLLITSVFVSKKLANRFFGIVQLRNEIHDKDIQDGQKETNTGYHLMVVTPQLSYSVAGRWIISALYDVPVYKNYRGKQLTPKFAYAVSLSRDFSNCSFRKKRDTNKK